MMNKLENMKKEITEAIQVFAPHNYVDEIRHSCGTIEITFKERVGFDKQRELRKTLSELLDLNPDKIKFIA